MTVHLISEYSDRLIEILLKIKFTVTVTRNSELATRAGYLQSVRSWSSIEKTLPSLTSTPRAMQALPLA